MTDNRKRQELLLACWSGTQNGRDIFCDTANRFVFTGSSCCCKYSGVCYYKHRCFKGRMLQRKVFISKIRMLQRTHLLQRKNAKKKSFINKIRMLQPTEMLQQKSVTNKIFINKIGMLQRTQMLQRKFFINKIMMLQRTEMLQRAVFIKQTSMLQRTEMVPRTKATTNRFCQ